MRDRLAAKAASVTLTLSRVNEGGTFAGTVVDASGDDSAVVGRTVFKRNEIGGAAIEFGERDYLIPVASYVLTELGAVEPMVGDRLTETVNGTSKTFEILPITGEPAWRYTDGSLTRYRIHVKRVTDERGE